MKKSRTVMVVLELETDWNLTGLKSHLRNLVDVPELNLSLRQISVQVAQPANFANLTPSRVSKRSLSLIKRKERKSNDSHKRRTDIDVIDRETD
jgi:hypothetical protein